MIGLKNYVVKQKKREKGLDAFWNRVQDSRYSLVVTHPTTNRPAHGLSMTERTGSPVFHVLWSIAEGGVLSMYI
jgi:hypothetical protein